MKKIISLLAAAILVLSLCGCDKKTESNDTIGGDNSDIIIDDGAENYFGGKGKLTAISDVDFRDDNNIYIWGFDTLKKLNTTAETLSIACQTPGCTHNNSGCKAYLTYLGGNQKRYCVFNNILVKNVDESVQQSDGTFSESSCLYVCTSGGERKVFENTFPEGEDAERFKNTNKSMIIYPLGDEYLVARSGMWEYILDTDFNIKFTILDPGSYSGGTYYINGEIYYINKLYQLIKINKESGERSVVDLDSMKITEGDTDGETLWFSNDEMKLCSYNPQSGEIKNFEEKAIRITRTGKYVEYKGDGKVFLYNTESGEIRETDLDINNDRLLFGGENYYIYNSADDVLNQYDESLSSVIKSYDLVD